LAESNANQPRERGQHDEHDQPRLAGVLLGYALGVIPGSRAARLFVAYLGKRLGVKPKQIEKFDEATDSGSDGDDSGS